MAKMFFASFIFLSATSMAATVDVSALRSITLKSVAKLGDIQTLGDVWFYEAADFLGRPGDERDLSRIFVPVQLNGSLPNNQWLAVSFGLNGDNRLFLIAAPDQTKGHSSVNFASVSSIVIRLRKVEKESVADFIGALEKLAPGVEVVTNASRTRVTVNGLQFGHIVGLTNLLDAYANMIDGFYFPSFPLQGDWQTAPARKISGTIDLETLRTFTKKFNFPNRPNLEWHELSCDQALTR